MKKPLLYKVFKLGKLPKNIDQSKLSLSDEGIKIITLYKNFKAPGKRFNNKKTMFLGSIACTENRILAFAFSKPLLNLEIRDQRLKAIDFSGSKENVLSMQFDASDFDEKSSGKVTYEFHTTLAKEILNKIQ